MGSNPVHDWIFFFRPYFHYCLSTVHFCNYPFHIRYVLFSSNRAALEITSVTVNGHARVKSYITKQEIIVFWWRRTCRPLSFPRFGDCLIPFGVQSEKCQYVSRHPKRLRPKTAFLNEYLERSWCRISGRGFETGSSSLALWMEVSQSS